jgi:hypothetical protein
MSAFDSFRKDAYPFQYKGRLSVAHLVGGVPSDPKVAEGWIRTKMGVTAEVELQKFVAQTVLERGVSTEEAVQIANTMKNLNGFKRGEQASDHPGELFIEGRQLKAALKEAISVAIAANKLTARGWGKTNKGLLGFAAEHIFVVEERLYLGVAEPSEIQQRFVHTWKGAGIQYEELVHDAVVNFTVIADYEFSEKEWAQIWLTGEHQGLGATRSMGYGVYRVEEWEQITKKSDLIV